MEVVVVDSQRRDFTNSSTTSGFWLVGTPIATKAWKNTNSEEDIVNFAS